MSNVETAKLYESIINEVISDSRQDFEDSGIDESTLQDLKRIWCEKLTQAGVAKFLWDDEEQQRHAPIMEHVGAPSSVASGIPNLHNTHTNLVGNGLGLEFPNVHTYHNSVAHDSDGASGLELPALKQEYEDSNGLILPRVGQSDGSFEFTMYTDNGAEFVRKMKSQRQKKKVVGQADGGNDDDDDDDDIFNDSDDINSDLDDGLESEKSDDEDGDQEGQIMLCLYDKVQRVKNKWKSNLKEGIANIDGRDYVFQKATGESEW